jgi:hypothetical protein
LLRRHQSKPLPLTANIANQDAERAFRASAIRVILACLAVALVIGVSGAARDIGDTLIWAVETVVGALMGITVARLWIPQAWFDDKLWAAALAIAGAVTLPMTALVLIVAVLWRHMPLSLALGWEVLPSVFGTSLVMTALAFLVRRTPTQTHAAPASAPPPKFLSRLPSRLAGGEIFAVEAEDHYLRLHTSLGQDLILMRLADAVAELEGVEGAQTHRSWWVAKAAVTAAERADGRATLTLKDGAEVPVSRGFAKQLRAAGWF